MKDPLFNTDFSSNGLYPFGSAMPGRNSTSDNYRFGFNGKENDNEVKGIGNQQDYGMRIYDPRLGRFLSADPLIVQEQKYAWYSPYQFAGNKPIRFIDIDGLEPGEPFGTREDAALNFASIYGKFSIQENREYGATIYKYEDKNGNVKYTYTNPIRGSKAGVRNTYAKKKEGLAAAGIHSHGAYDPLYNSNMFSGIPGDPYSGGDIGVSEYNEFSEFVSTPSGVIYEYDPKDDNVYNINYNAPSDPNDPEQYMKGTSVNTDAIPMTTSQKQTSKDRRQYTKENRKTRREYKKEYKKILKERS